MSRIFKFSLIIALSAFIFSCNTSKSSLNNQSEILDNSLLWKIDGNGLKKPSYLYGTIHLIKSEDYFLPKSFNKAFESAQKIVFEIDMTTMDEMEEIAAIMPKIMLPEEQSLSKFLSESDYNKVKEYFNNKGIPAFLVDRVKPLFLSTLADVDMGALTEDQNLYKSYEMEFQKMAEDQKKMTGGLETVDYQLSVIDSIPLEDQAKMLLSSVEDADDDNDELIKMTELYKKQDINKLYTSIKNDDISKFEKILLQNRNSNWIPKMKEMMSANNTFFAVGAGHLGGPDGVINLLRKYGYRVTALN